MPPAPAIERTKPCNVVILIRTVDVIGLGAKPLEVKATRTLLYFRDSKPQQRDCPTSAQVFARVL